MDNKIHEVIKNFICRHCGSADKLSAIKDKYDNTAVVEVRCLRCKEKEVIVI